MVQNLGKKWANTTYVVHTQDSTINLWDVSDFHCLVKIKVLPVVIPIEFRSFIVLRSWLNDDQGLKWKISKYPLCNGCYFGRSVSVRYIREAHIRDQTQYILILDFSLNVFGCLHEFFGCLHENYWISSWTFWWECFSEIYLGGPLQPPDSIYPYFNEKPDQSHSPQLMDWW